VFGGSHSYEGLYIEWLWEGGDELPGMAHGESYKGEKKRSQE